MSSGGPLSSDPATAEDYVHIENTDSALAVDPNGPKSPEAIPDHDPNRDPDPNGSNTIPIQDRESDGVILVDGDRLRSDGGSTGGGDGDSVAEGEPENALRMEELIKRLTVLSCESTAEGGSCDVYLVGTAHVSLQSCKEVQAVISYLKPQVVFLELCSSRVAVLTPQNLTVPTMREMMDMWKKNQNIFGILYSWFLAKVASKLEVFPGSEFRVAFEEAMKYSSKVVLGDRPVNITLRRTWGSMPLWHKAKLMYSLLFQGVFLPSPDDLNKMLKDMDDVDALTLVIQEMSKEFPTLMETLVHERDRYMSSTLLEVAGENNSVVAVVGKGHLQGIKKHWQQPVEMKDLLEIPSRQQTISAGRVVTSMAVAVAGIAIVSGIYLAVKK